MQASLDRLSYQGPSARQRYEDQEGERREGGVDEYDRVVLHLVDGVDQVPRPGTD